MKNNELFHDGYDHFFNDDYEKKFPIKLPNNSPLPYITSTSNDDSPFTNYENYNSQPTRQIICPKCNNQVHAIVINEHIYWDELWHKDPKCHNVWTFTPYDICKQLQKAKAEKLLLEYHDNWNNKGGKERSTILFGSAVSILAAVCTGGASLLTFTAGAWVFNKVLTSDDKSNAELYSYLIEEEYFSNLPNHYLDNRFLEERKPFIKRIETRKE